MEPVKTIREVFAANLRELRGGRSKEDLSAAAGIPFPTYRDMESGDRLPKKWENVEALARFYGVSETRFFMDPDLLKEAPGAKELDSLREILSGLATLNESKLRAVLKLISGLNGGSEPKALGSDLKQAK